MVVPASSLVPSLAQFIPNVKPIRRAPRANGGFPAESPIVKKQDGDAAQDNDEEFGVGDSHETAALNEENVRKDIGDTEDDDVDHIQPCMARGDDESVSHEIFHDIKNVDGEEEISNGQHGTRVINHEKVFKDEGYCYGHARGEEAGKEDCVAKITPEDMSQISVSSGVEARHNIGGLDLGESQERKGDDHDEFVDDLVIANLDDVVESAQH